MRLCNLPGLPNFPRAEIFSHHSQFRMFLELLPFAWELSQNRELAAVLICGLAAQWADCDIGAPTKRP